MYITANYAFKTINFESRNINCIYCYIYLKMTYLDTIKYRVHYFGIILNIMRHGTETSADTCAKPTEKYIKNLSLCWQLLVDCSNFCKVGYYLPWHIFLDILIYRLTYIPGKKAYKVWKKEEGEYWGAIANSWWLSGKKKKKKLPMQEALVWSLEGPLEEETSTHSSILARIIPWTDEPGGLQSMELQRVGHDRMNEHTCTAYPASNIPSWGNHTKDSPACLPLIRFASWPTLVFPMWPIANCIIL